MMAARVIDASVLVNALGDDGPDGVMARDELRRAEQLVAPDLIDVETAAVLRRLWVHGVLDEHRFEVALNHLIALDFDRVPTRRLLSHAVRLRHDVTMYDACYVALAQILNAELITGDARLGRAVDGRCRVRVLGEPER